MGIGSAVHVGKFMAYDWLSLNSLGNTGSRGRSKNNLRGIMMSVSVKVEDIYLAASRLGKYPPLLTST